MKRPFPAPKFMPALVLSAGALLGFVPTRLYSTWRVHPELRVLDEKIAEQRAIVDEIRAGEKEVRAEIEKLVNTKRPAQEKRVEKKILDQAPVTSLRERLGPQRSKELDEIVATAERDLAQRVDNFAQNLPAASPETRKHLLLREAFAVVVKAEEEFMPRLNDEQRRYLDESGYSALSGLKAPPKFKELGMSFSIADQERRKRNQTSPDALPAQ
jgi:hypothetical protein